MNPTTRPLDPDLLASLRPLRRAARSVVLTLGLLGAVMGLAVPASAAENTPPHSNGGGAGKTQQQDLTRKVNEYEGQHRLGLAGGKDPEIPTLPG